MTKMNYINLFTLHTSFNESYEKKLTKSRWLESIIWLFTFMQFYIEDKYGYNPVSYYYTLYNCIPKSFNILFYSDSTRYNNNSKKLKVQWNNSYLSKFSNAVQPLL